PKPALLLRLNEHMQTVTRRGALDINNRISDTGDKVTNRRLQHAAIETVIKVEAAKPRTIQHHAKTIAGSGLHLGKGKPSVRIIRRGRRTINHDRTLIDHTHPHALIISKRSLRSARSTLAARLATKA